MIYKYKLFFCIALFCLLITKSFSQYNASTNSFSAKDEPALTIPMQQSLLMDLSQVTGIPCSPNTFWAISAGVDQYTLNGNSVTFNSTVCLPYYGNLAYCNNLDGGSFSPTFYDASDSTAAYYNGSGWTTGLTANARLFNCGGNGNYLYFEYVPVGTYPKTIARYDGTSVTNIYTLPDTSEFISVADLDIDDNGNIWFFTGFPISPYNSDTLNVITPTGQLIKQFPISINTLNAYGSFMLNGTIYIGLGSANTVHPNSLIPVYISPIFVYAGNPIPMPAGINYGDLASCNAGSPLAIIENGGSEIFSLYPNPAKDVLTVTAANHFKNEYSIVDLKGAVIKRFFSDNETTNINISVFDAGVYIVECRNATGITRNKFVKL